MEKPRSGTAIILEEKILMELLKIERKIDRLNSIILATPAISTPVLLEDWLTEEQARELLQRGATSLWDLRKRKKISFSKIGNRTYYQRKSIIDFLEKGKK